MKFLALILLAVFALCFYFFADNASRAGQFDKKAFPMLLFTTALFWILFLLDVLWLAVFLGSKKP